MQLDAVPVERLRRAECEQAAHRAERRPRRVAVDERLALVRWHKACPRLAQRVKKVIRLCTPRSPMASFKLAARAACAPSASNAAQFIRRRGIQRLHQVGPRDGDLAGGVDRHRPAGAAHRCRLASDGPTIAVAAGRGVRMSSTGIRQPVAAISPQNG